MIILAKKESICANCGDKILVADKINWEFGRRGQTHVNCIYINQKIDNNSIEQSRLSESTLGVPSPIGMKYLQYQLAGIEYAQQHKNVLIADEMGLGKTIQAIGIINISNVCNSLVICPKSVVLNWKNELNKWLVDCKYIYYTPCFENINKNLSKKVVVISYEQAKKYEKEILLNKWDILIIDEAHYIKNLKTQRCQIVQNIANQSKRVIALTGTPILNRPIELYPILKVLKCGQWGSYMQFAKIYANAHQTPYGWDFKGASNLEDLNKRLRSTCMVRRMKKDVLKDLPDKQRQIIELSEIQISKEIQYEIDTYNLYEKDIENLLSKLELSINMIEYDDALKKLSCIQKIYFDEIARIRVETAKQKLPVMIDYIRTCLESSDCKYVIFVRHKEILNSLVKELKVFGVVSITGENTTEQRQKAITNFQTYSIYRVFIGTIGAAGVGINLTESSNVIFCEFEYEPGLMIQAEDRCHRFGQKNSVSVKYLVLNKTVDVKIIHTLIRKTRIIDKVLM